MDSVGLLVGKPFAPGDRICRTDDSLIAGLGTHEYHNWIHASVLGRLALDQDIDAASSTAGPGQEQQHQQQSKAESATAKKTVVKVNSFSLTFPQIIDSIVIAQVVRVTSRVAHCTLLACNRYPLHSAFKAQIRREDTRATERDRVELADCFRAGDIVQARVLTLGQNGAYLLSTAQNELGVVMALGQHGKKLVPCNWTEMKCPVSGDVFKRKVANVPQEFVHVFIERLLADANIFGHKS